MKVTELKALTREHGIRGYSRLRRAELVALLQNNPPPLPQMSTWEPIDDRLRPDRPTLWRLRQPPQQEMRIFEQQEMSKSRNKLNNWYDWLVNCVPKTVKDKASRVFKTFKDKIMGLYNGITGSAGNQTLDGPCWQSPALQFMEVQRSTEPEPIELEQAFNGAYRSYRINGRPRMDVETFFY